MLELEELANCKVTYRLARFYQAKTSFTGQLDTFKGTSKLGSLFFFSLIVCLYLKGACEKWSE